MEEVKEYVKEQKVAHLDETGWAVRPGVLWRKCSFGTEIRRGSLFVERMMTVVALGILRCAKSAMVGSVATTFGPGKGVEKLKGGKVFDLLT